MLKRKIHDILSAAKPQGWVLEPDAKHLLALEGLSIPKFHWAKHPEDAAGAARMLGYPVVCKVVSSKILHKSDVGGVVLGVNDEEKLKRDYSVLEDILRAPYEIVNNFPKIILDICREK